MFLASDEALQRLPTLSCGVQGSCGTPPSASSSAGRRSSRLRTELTQALRRTMRSKPALCWSFGRSVRLSTHPARALERLEKGCSAVFHSISKPLPRHRDTACSPPAARAAAPFVSPERGAPTGKCEA